MAYIFEHAKLGFCWYDLIALAVLIAAVTVYIVKIRKMKKLQTALTDKLQEVTPVPGNSSPEAK